MNPFTASRRPIPILVLLLVAAPASALAASQTAGAQAAAADTSRTGCISDAVGERNKALARAFYEDLWFSDRSDRWSEYVADEYVVHDIGDRKGVVEPGVKQKGIADFFRSQGRMSGSIDFQIAEGDLVATRWQWDFHPTSLPFRLLGGRERIPIINVFRFEDGRIVEIWNHRHDIDTGRANIPFVKGLGIGLVIALIGWGVAFVLSRRGRRSRFSGRSRAASGAAGATVSLLVCVLLLGAAPTRALAQESVQPTEARSEPGTIAITDVAVVDVEAGRLLHHRTVLVEDGWITTVGPAQEVAVPPGAEVVDATGLYLAPGLWDAHVHSAASADWHFPLLIAHGITSVRNLHTTVDTSLAFTNALKRRLASGEMLGPRFLANGGVVDGEPAVWPGSAVVETAAEARATVDSLTDGGADFIKTYDRLSPEAFSAILDQARLRGIPVDGHVPMSVAAKDAAAAGMRTIEHGTGMAMGCSAKADSLRAVHAAHMRTPDMDDRGLAFALLLVAARASGDERLCMETVRAYRQNGVAVTPTFVARKGPRPVLEDSAAMALIPGAVGARWRQMAERGPGPFEAVVDDTAHMARVGIRSFQMLHEAGVSILAGTDLGNPFLVPGRSLHRELEVLVDEVGLSPLEALRSATLTPARVFGMADSLGTVAQGKLADLVLLRENPLTDIRHLRSIQGVVLAGRYFDRSELDALLRRVPD